MEGCPWRSNASDRGSGCLRADAASASQPFCKFDGCLGRPSCRRHPFVGSTHLQLLRADLTADRAGNQSPFSGNGLGFFDFNHHAGWLRQMSPVRAWKQPLILTSSRVRDREFVRANPMTVAPTENPFRASPGRCRCVRIRSAPVGHGTVVRHNRQDRSLRSTPQGPPRSPVNNSQIRVVCRVLVPR
jgi:hypothetical protein